VSYQKKFTAVAARRLICQPSSTERPTNAITLAIGSFRSQSADYRLGLISLQAFIALAAAIAFVVIIGPVAQR
jgi:hypothetical protein